MTTLIVGANGQLGRALQQEFPDAVALDRSKLDVTDAAAVRNYRWADVDVVLNAAAWTAVDAAEDRPTWPPSGPPTSMPSATSPAPSGPRAPRSCTSPASTSSTAATTARSRRTGRPTLSVYGRSRPTVTGKAADVAEHYLVRTTWVVGDGGNFVRTMAGLAERGVSPTVVDDQIAGPPSRGPRRRDRPPAARARVRHLQPDQRRRASIVGRRRRCGVQTRGQSADDVGRINAEVLRRQATGHTRPLNGVLDLSKITATGLQPRDWRIALADYLAAAPRLGASPDSVNLGFESLVAERCGRTLRHRPVTPRCRTEWGETCTAQPAAFTCGRPTDRPERLLGPRGR